MNKQEWIKETSELLTDLEAKRQVLHDKYEQIENELIDLEQRITSGHDLIRDYMNKHSIESVTPTNVKLGNLADKSYPELLIEIAKQSNGILNVADATNILLENKVGADKKAIAHNIYGAISRSSAHFLRISRGQYRFTNHIDTNEGHKDSKRRIKVKTGVKQAVKNLKDANPLMTVQEVIERLQKDGFDFKGKKPAQSVNMAWVALGYSSVGKQLPMKSPTQLEIPT